MEQHHIIADFSTSDAWIILSPIEASIKRKIEAVGTPLKEWDISIYRGVLTGCNDAFIIDTAKRDEILANCESAEERQRTEALIRPILRGRDIKRYSYNWAGLWLIYIPWHFPLQHDPSIQGASEKAEQDFQKQYPAVYTHMLQYKDSLLKRNKAETGIRYEWYALQRWGAKYWEDFDKPKIIWKVIGSQLAFTIDTAKILLNNACYLLTGNQLKHILGFLNSPALIWYSEITNMNKTGVGDAQVGAQNIVLFPIPIKRIQEVEILVDKLLVNPSDQIVKQQLSDKIYSIYGLNTEESNFLNDLNL